MSPDALLLALVAIGDLALLVLLRRRRARRKNRERMTISLRLAIRRTNAVNTIRNQHLRRA